MKPDRANFDICLTGLGVVPTAALFVDDRLENINAAAGMEIQTFHFVGDDAQRVLRTSWPLTDSEDAQFLESL